MALLRKAGVCETLGVSKATLDRLRKEPGFPSPVRMTSTACPRWWSEDVLAWARARTREQSNGAAIPRSA